MIPAIKRLLIKLYMLSVLHKEKLFLTTKCQLRYLFFKKKKAGKLLVIFSAYPGKKQKARYNYILKFRQLNYHRLYILDDFGPGERGAYYLGENRDFYIEEAVVQLIEKTREELGLTKDEVVTCGSSKGGFAAIYFENKYHYLASVSGAPQTRLGDYLHREVHEAIYQFIVGQATEESFAYLNDLLTEAIQQKKTNSRIYLHVSQNEHTYEDHVLPLMSQVTVSDLNLGSYDNHHSVGTHFPRYALDVLKQIEKE